MTRLGGIHFTDIPASSDRLRSRNPEPAPAEAGGTGRAAALAPRLREVTPGSCRPLECPQPAAPFAKKGPGGAGASVEETPINSYTLASAATPACDAHHIRGCPRQALGRVTPTMLSRLTSAARRSSLHPSLPAGRSGSTR